QGEIVALVGPNGAGKSSLLRAIARATPIAAGRIALSGDNVSHIGPEQIVCRGVSLVPEGRELFFSLSVADNLAVGRYAQIRAGGFRNLFLRSTNDERRMAARLERVYALFPILRERRDQLAGTLSGGQGQMLAIGRALMNEPQLLMLDEPSLGLAPQVVAEIMRCLARLRDEGLTVLLVEQNARAALEIADRAYVLSAGRIVASGRAEGLLTDPAIAEAYIGWEHGAERAVPLPIRGETTAGGGSAA
ncbi:MAG: ABC transporter ATP-binding protein, partial [Roseiarcus sp.]